ncbi:MAG: hypothetical protein O3B65_05795, partial [Chloroflexi bacterium]|nr:hypothetical protein [Chloroflexota bacterium]
MKGNGLLGRQSLLVTRLGYAHLGSGGVGSGPILRGEQLRLIINALRAIPRIVVNGFALDRNLNEFIRLVGESGSRLDNYDMDQYLANTFVVEFARRKRTLVRLAILVQATLLAEAISLWVIVRWVEYPSEPRWVWLAVFAGFYAVGGLALLAYRKTIMRVNKNHAYDAVMAYCILTADLLSAPHVLESREQRRRLIRRIEATSKRMVMLGESQVEASTDAEFKADMVSTYRGYAAYIANLRQSVVAPVAETRGELVQSYAKVLDAVLAHRFGDLPSATPGAL